MDFITSWSSWKDNTPSSSLETETTVIPSTPFFKMQNSFSFKATMASLPVKQHEDLLELGNLVRERGEIEISYRTVKLPALLTVSRPPGQCSRSDHNFLS